MLITEIILKQNMVRPGDPSRFRIGEPVNPEIEGSAVVEKINYNPPSRLFNKGLETNQSGYAIFFEGIPERRFIPEDMVGPIEVVRTDAVQSAIPELPS